MLATLLFSAAFATGDTLSYSIRRSAVLQYGLVDVQITGKADENSGRIGYFDQEYVKKVEQVLAGEAVAGVAPLIREQAAVIAPDNRLSEPSVTILGLEPALMAAFNSLETAAGQSLSVTNLNPAEVYISQALADDLAIAQGDRLDVYLGPKATRLTVAGIYAEGAKPAGTMSLALPLAELQKITGNDGRINTIIISNEGDLIGGATHVDAVLTALKPFTEANELTAASPKQTALKMADEAGSMFSTIFLLFGQFSIAAGILLIFLIFVMLAAERKRELGIMRAVGTQRGHVVRMFVYEGAMYALMAAAVGSLLGLVVGWGMVRVMAAAFGTMAESGFELTYYFNWRSLVIAYTLGMVFTFAIVLISSWRVSRLNIVRAIRDIPEPKIQRRSIKGWIFTILLPIVGAVATMSGAQYNSVSLFMLGVSLMIIGVALLAWRLGVPERIPFSLGGLGLLYWWLLPQPEFIKTLLPDLGNGGLEMFFLSGIMVVIGAVWTVIYNADVITGLFVLLFGNVRGLSSVLRMAVAYSMHNRFRTGMILAMFSLVIFTLVVMAFILNAVALAVSDVDKLSSNFQIEARAGYANPINDMAAALEEAGLNRDDFEVIAAFTGMPIRIAQEGVDNAADPVDFYISAANDAYLDHVTYNFQLMAAGYDNPADVWQALREGQDVVVVRSWIVPSRNNFTVSDTPFNLEGFYAEDEILPEIYVHVSSPFTGQLRRLQVIGVLEGTAFYAGNGPVLTSQAVLHELAPVTMPAQSYLFRLREGVDAAAVTRELELAFVENGLQATVTADQIARQVGANLMINNLLQGFMSLGLVVGIAALGVIAARSVVERHQQIGVLRAIGFQRGMVQMAFLLENSFVAFMGILLGVALGMAVAHFALEGMAESMPGIEYVIPWSNILVVAGVAYGASLLMTLLAARQAAHVQPAEALRFE
jgi:putative ABC transport system permease protein